MVARLDPSLWLFVSLSNVCFELAEDAKADKANIQKLTEVKTKLERRVEDLDKTVNKLKIEVEERDNVIGANYDAIQTLRRKVQVCTVSPLGSVERQPGLVAVLRPVVVDPL